MHGYVVEYQPGAWVASSRLTEVIDCAIVYDSEVEARRALRRLCERFQRDFPEAQIYPVRVRVERVSP